VLHCGNTFLIPKRSHQVEHLWIVLTEPDPQTHEAACVNITTVKPSSEQTLILKPGDHRFVKQDSEVYYRDAQILNLAKVDEMLNKTQYLFVCSVHDPCSPELLKRIQDGLLRSKEVKREVKDYCKEKWGFRL
jgi:hypothetical protein